MSITRRALLGTLIGLPFGVKATQATQASPEIDEVKVTDQPYQPAQPAFSTAHIKGIGNALLNHVEQSLADRGIRHASEIYPGDRGFGNFFLIPWADDKKSYRDIVQEFAVPAAEVLARGLNGYYDSKARWIGVQMYYSPEGLAVSVLATHSESPPIRGNAIYSEWVRPI